MTLTDSEYFDQIVSLVLLLQSIKADRNELLSLAQARKDKAKILFEPTLPGGWFYEHKFLEHIGLFLSFSDLNDFFKSQFESGQFFNTDFQTLEFEPPKWLSINDD